MDNDFAKVLTEEMDEETISKMPEWLKRLRDGYHRKLCRCA